MENAAEALKIAFGVALFIIALTLSISCFSQATTAVNAILKLRDRDMRYEQIKSAEGLTREVGVETIVPTMYQAYKENIEIYFKDRDGNPLPIYYRTDQYGRRIIDEHGREEIVDCIVLDNNKEAFGNYGNKTIQQLAKEHLDMILAGKDAWDIQYDGNQEMLDIAKRYEMQFHEDYPDGFYNFLKVNKFEESLGEYYESRDDKGNSIKKRVITYQQI